MRGMEPEWLASIISWARDEPRIAAVFLFESRAKGTHRPDSDLDLAAVLTGNSQDSAFAYATCRGTKMEKGFAAMLPVKLHLHFPEASDAVVWPAGQDHGIMIYSG